MIAGVGMDLVDIRRIEAMLAAHGERAKARLFSDGERSYSDSHAAPARHYAARFAAKEACYKALAGSEDARAISWRDIEVVRDAHGIPSLRLHGRAAARAEALGVVRLHLTLTHAEGVAGAVVIAERE
jgi:holo-[acyl-carrier protein] synthase